MKYLNYIGKLKWKITAKSVIYLGMLLLSIGLFTGGIISGTIGAVLLLWMVIAYKKRRYSRGIVYSYTLENGIYLPRSTDEPRISIVKDEDNGWILRDKALLESGYVKKLKVSKLKYQLVYWFLWGWVDDDCDRDTVPIGYGRDILNGKHFTWFPKWLIALIKKEQDYLLQQPHGNSFSLGNNLKSNWTPILSTLWMFRNLAYNFNYSQEEIKENDPNNFYYRTKWKFPGLAKNKTTGKLEIVWTNWHFGYIPYSNPSRKGRLVFFTEDIDKVSAH